MRTDGELEKTGKTHQFIYLSGCSIHPCFSMDNRLRVLNFRVEM